MIVPEQERLWIFDFDGTLSPLVPDRGTAQLHPDCGRLLEALVTLPEQNVAILSSRALEDLIPRVPVKGVYLGGGSGIEWQLPDGCRIIPERSWEERLGRTRAALLPELDRIAALPGIELEDKTWSVALHTRKAQPEEKEHLYARVISWLSPHPVRVFSGPEVLEIQLLPEIDKGFGVRILCDLLKFGPSGKVVYAGDDENDAVAMRLVMQMGGIALMVGGTFPVAGTRVVRNQLGLVREVSGMAGIRTLV